MFFNRFNLDNVKGVTTPERCNEKNDFHQLKKCVPRTLSLFESYSNTIRTLLKSLPFVSPFR